MKTKSKNTVVPFRSFFRHLLGLAVLAVFAAATVTPTRAASGSTLATAQHPTLHKTIKVNGLDIFYREAGPTNAPTIVLLHGFPTSSHMFRNLIPALADRYHVIAPDYPGYGQSSMPGVGEFKYRFDNLTDVVSFDWNCPKYITPRYTEEEVRAAVAPLTQRIAELEASLKAKS